MKKRKKITLTRKLYKKRLKDMILNHPDVNNCCPAKLGFDLYREGITLIRFTWTNYPCDVCHEFMDIPRPSDKCPCSFYGCEEAIEIAREKLNL